MAGRNDLGLGAREPACTIYTPAWTEALAWLNEFVSEKHRTIYRSLFACLEEGWRILRPLQLCIEELQAEAGEVSKAAADIALFIGDQITDNFRDLTETCLELLPSRTGWKEELRYGDIEPEAGNIALAVRLVALMEQNPACPPAIRSYAAPAGERITAWAESLPDVLAPIIELIETDLYGRPPSNS